MIKLKGGHHLAAKNAAKPKGVTKAKAKEGGGESNKSLFRSILCLDTDSGFITSEAWPSSSEEAYPGRRVGK